MPKNYQYYCQLTIRQQKTHQNFITSSNGECRYKFAGSLLSQKRGYKMNFISIHLGLVADAKKMINIIANRLLYDKIIVKIRLFYQTVNADTSLLSQC